MAGRGVLLDYVRYCEKHGKDVPYAFSNHAITVEDLDAIAKDEGVTWKTGDILFVRTGFVRAYESATDEVKKETFSGKKTAFIGVIANAESRDWLWNHHFAAVAGDTFAFEGWSTLQRRMGTC